MNDVSGVVRITFRVLSKDRTVSFDNLYSDVHSYCAAAGDALQTKNNKNKGR